MKTKHSVIAMWCWTLGASCLLALGCGGSEPICGPEHDLVPDIIEDDEDLNTFWVASLAVDELKIVGAGAEHTTLIQAHFNDFSEYMVQLAERLEFQDYPACYVYTSRPVTSGDPIPLGIEQVTFRGLVGGDLILAPDEFDHIPTELLARRGFDAATIGIEVASAEGPADFPALTAEIAAPQMPILLSIGDVAPVDLALAPQIGISSSRIEPLEVHWEPSGAEYVEIKILPGAGSATPYAKLRCITFDDGCLEIPAAALSHLALDEATNFQFRIEHHFFVLHAIKQGDQTKAAALIDTSAALEGTVLR
jgi:hypothetical protein